MSVYTAALVIGGVVGRAAVMIAGLDWNGTAAWFCTLVGMVIGGLAVARFVASRLGDAGDAASALARAEVPPPRDAPRILEFARIAEECRAAGFIIKEYGTKTADLRHEQDALMDAVEGGVLALDREQRVINLNRAAERMLGLSARAPRGTLLQELTRFDALNRFVSDAIESAAPMSDEFQLIRPAEEGGRIGFSVRAASRPVHDAQGRLEGVMVFLTDVTRLRRLEAVRTDFAANVSHELRTPITNILGYVDTMIESPPTDPAATRTFLAVIQRNAKRLSEIVDDMLALTNLERPDTTESLDKSPTRLIDIIRRVLEEVEREKSDRSTEIKIEGDPSLLAMVNPRLAQQALQNLVTNAIRSSPSGRVVIIRCSQVDLPADPKAVEMAVIDEGPGIGPEHLPRLFERFYRVDKARARDQGGSGLGLSIVKHIALAHQGRVSVESVVGKGSTFRLRFPQG